VNVHRALHIYGHGDDSPGNEMNSRASFHVAMGLPIDGVELDVRRTADDALVVHHDHVLADGRRIDATLRRHVPVDVPDLVDVLDICRGRTVNIEIKNFPSDPGFDPTERITDRVLDLLAERDDEVIISSFGMAALDRVRAVRPDLATAVLLFYRGDPDELLDDVVRHGHRLVHPFAPRIDRAFVAAARARALTVNVWTGRDDRAELEHVVELDVDGVITGAPTLLLELLGEGSEGS
jgi:glycerophosphoryl diester phosphodiesterase